MTPNGSSSANSRTGKILITVILTLALSLQVFHALNWEIAYDEVWNLSYAKIEPFFSSFIELRHNSHPPLHAIWLRVPMSLGDDIFWARLGSIIPSLLFIYIIFITAKKLRLRDPLPYLVAFMLAISNVVVNLAACVRAYTLMAMFIALGIYYFIDVIRDFLQVEPWKIRMFSLSCVFAIWTEYCAALIVFPLLLCLLLSIIYYRYPWKDIAKRLLSVWDAVLIFLAGLIGIALYFSWTLMPVRQGHVEKYYLDGGSTLQFILQGIKNNFSYFTPLKLDSNWSALFLALFSIGITLFLVRATLKKRKDTATAAILISNLAVWSILIVTGIKGVYPFGGSMRHQFVLFPLFFLSGAILVGHFSQLFNSRKIWYIFCAFVSAFVSYVSYTGFSGPPLEEFPGEPLFQEAASAFDKLINENDAVYLTNFNSFAFLYHKLDHRWLFQGKGSDMYNNELIVKEGTGVHLVVDRTQWLVPMPLTDRIMQRFGAILEQEAIDRLWVFSANGGEEFYSEYAGNDAWRAAAPSRIRVSECFPIGAGYTFYLEKIEESPQSVSNQYRE